MSLPTVLFIVVLIIIAARHKHDRAYLDQRLDRFADHRADPAEAALPDTRRLEHEVEELRDRVRVLERIVTDANAAEARHSQRIADEIEQLRDKA